MSKTNDILERASTLHLLVELMYDGKAEIIPELAAIEPIEPEAIRKALIHRAGKNCGPNFDDWYKWFLETDQTGKHGDRKTLKRMSEFKEKNDYFIAKLSQKRDDESGK